MDDSDFEWPPPPVLPRPSRSFDSPPPRARKAPLHNTSPHVPVEAPERTLGDLPRQGSKRRAKEQQPVGSKRKKTVKPPSGKQQRKAARLEKKAHPPVHDDGEGEGRVDDVACDGDADDDACDGDADDDACDGDADDDACDGYVDDEASGKKPKVDVRAFEQMRRQKAAEAGLRNTMPRFKTRTFRSLEKALEAQLEYQEANFCWFRRRDSCSTEKWNEKNPDNKVIVDPKFELRRFVLYCTHGCTQRSRSSGIRDHSYTRYTGCEARITFMLKSKMTPSGREWWYEIVRETTTHNHNINKILYSTYEHSTVLLDDDLFGKTLDVLVQTNTSTAAIANWMSTEAGVPVSTQRVRNILSRRLGGPHAQARLRKILARYLAIDGNRCALMQDEDGVTIGVLMQSRMQALFFEIYGDVLTFDVTYNTNNIGYKMGSLLVTGPTGRGIPIFDFLTISESKITLTMVLKWFRDMNPGAPDIEAFVVDKSMAEMGAIEEVFPSATIFLCQFHVKDAVGRALAQRRFALSPRKQADVASMFSAMMYSRTIEAYNDGLREFREEVGSLCPSLLQYFEKNWFPCRDKWSNVGRAKAFSVGNSTTNRVESNWTQIKAIIRDKTGIDRCVSALLQHQVTVFRKLQSAIATAGASSRTFIGVPHFLRPVSVQLSDYALAKVSTQHDYFHLAKSQWSSDPCGNCATAAPPSRTTAAPLDPTACACAASVRVHTRTDEYVVDRSGSGWTCTCYFYVSQRLPCQHMMYVSQNVMGDRTLPRRTVARRWRMEQFVHVETSLAVFIPEMNKIPLQIPVPTQQPTADQDGEKPTASKKGQTGMYILRVKKGAQATGPLVLSRTGKRRMMRSELEEVTDRMVAVNSSHDFYQWVERLHEHLQPFLQALQAAQLPSGGGSAEPDAGVTDEGAESEDSDTEVVTAAFPPDTSDVRECVGQPESPCAAESDDDTDKAGGDMARDMHHNSHDEVMDADTEDNGNDEEMDAAGDDVVVDGSTVAPRPRTEDTVAPRTDVDSDHEAETDVDDEPESDPSEDNGFEYIPDSADEQARDSDDTGLSSRDSLFDSDDASNIRPNAMALTDSPNAMALTDYVAYPTSPSQVSLPDLQLSSSSLAILEADGSGAGVAAVQTDGPVRARSSPSEGSGAAVGPASSGAAVKSGAAVTSPRPSASSSGAGVASASTSGAAVTSAVTRGVSKSVPSGAAVTRPTTGPAVTSARPSESTSASTSVRKSGAGVARPSAATSGAVSRATSGAAVASASGVTGRSRSPFAHVACSTCPSKQFEFCAVSNDVVCQQCGTSVQSSNSRSAECSNSVLTESSNKPVVSSSKPRPSMSRTLSPSPSQEVIEVSSGDTSYASLLAEVAVINAKAEKRRIRNKRLAIRHPPEDEEENQFPNLHILNLPNPTKGFTKKEARAAHARRQLEKEKESEPKPPPPPTASIQEFNFWTRNSRDIMEVYQKHSSYSFFSPGRGTTRLVSATLAPPYGMHPFTIDWKVAARFKALLEDDARHQQANGAPGDGDMENPYSLESDADGNEGICECRAQGHDCSEGGSRGNRLLKVSGAQMERAAVVLECNTQLSNADGT